MNKSRLLLPLLAVGSLAGTVPAAATSDLWYRYPVTAGVGPCGGKIVEQVLEGGSVTFSYAKVVVACMGSPTQASWVLISGVECGDPINTKAGRCSGNSRFGAMGRIRALAEYAEGNKSSIRLATAVVGRDCKTIPSQRDASWSCQSYEDLAGMDLTVAAGPFKSAEGSFSLPIFDKSTELPLTFDRSSVVKPQASPKHIAFGEPETDALAALHCVSPGKIELFVSDPMDSPAPYKVFQGTIQAQGRREVAGFRVHLGGDGDSLALAIATDSLAVESLLKGRDFEVALPSGGVVRVPGTGAERMARSLVAACAPKPTPAQAVSYPSNIVPTVATSNSGWWVVLATGPGTPDRQSNGGAEVDRKAARCGIRTFNDFSSKFVGFKPGYNAFVLLGSPYGDKAMADANLRLVEGCFPGAYVKQARYLGE